MIAAIKLAHNVGQQRSNNGESVADSAGGAGCVNNERGGCTWAIEHPSAPAGQARMRGITHAVGTDLFHESGDLRLCEFGRDLGSDVARANTGSARGDDGACPGLVRGLNCVTNSGRLVRHDGDRGIGKPGGVQEFLGEWSRAILIGASCGAIRNRDDGHGERHISILGPHPTPADNRKYWEKQQ